MKESVNIYFVIAPLVVFGPLFLWILYNFGLKELTKIPEEVRHQRQVDAEAAERFRQEHARKRGRAPVGVVRGANRSPFGMFAQAVTYVWFAAVIGFFSASPPYAYTEPGAARIKVSLSHAGKRKVECRRRTPEEIAKVMEVDTSKVREIMKVSQEPTSLETPVGDEEDSRFHAIYQTMLLRDPSRPVS